MKSHFSEMLQFFTPCFSLVRSWLCYQERTPLMADAFLMPATATLSPSRERHCLRDPLVFHHSCTSSVPLRWKSNAAGTQQLLTWAWGSWEALHLKGMFPEGAQHEDFAPPPLEASYSPQVCDQTVPLPGFQLQTFHLHSIHWTYLCNPVRWLTSPGGGGLFTHRSSRPIYGFIYTPPTHASICSHISHETFQL